MYNLNSFIYQNFEKIIRETGNPWTPVKTIKENKGSCRDLSVLFMECCRSVGLPSRFTSGYNEIDIKTKQRQLHAWAEVFIPGGGWLGYDPTLDLQSEINMFHLHLLHCLLTLILYLGISGEPV